MHAIYLYKVVNKEIHKINSICQNVRVRMKDNFCDTFVILISISQRIRTY